MNTKQSSMISSDWIIELESRISDSGLFTPQKHQNNKRGKQEINAELAWIRSANWRKSKIGLKRNQYDQIKIVQWGKPKPNEFTNEEDDRMSEILHSLFLLLGYSAYKCLTRSNHELILAFLGALDYLQEITLSIPPSYKISTDVMIPLTPGIEIENIFLVTIKYTARAILDPISKRITCILHHPMRNKTYVFASFCAFLRTLPRGTKLLNLSSKTPFLIPIDAITKSTTFHHFSSAFGSICYVADSDGMVNFDDGFKIFVADQGKSISAVFERKGLYWARGLPKSVDFCFNGKNSQIWVKGGPSGEIEEIVMQGCGDDEERSEMLGYASWRVEDVKFIDIE